MTVESKDVTLISRPGAEFEGVGPGFCEAHGLGDEGLVTEKMADSLLQLRELEIATSVVVLAHAPVSTRAMESPATRAVVNYVLNQVPDANCSRTATSRVRFREQTEQNIPGGVEVYSLGDWTGDVD